MKFNLKEKLQQAKNASTTALTIAIVAADDAADRALEKLGNLQDATARKTGEIRAQVGAAVDHTRDTIREKTDVAKDFTVASLDKLGEGIEQKTTQLGNAATAFGKNARGRLTLRKPEAAPVAPAVEVAPVVEEAMKKAGKKASKKAAKKAAKKAPKA